MNYRVLGKTGFEVSDVGHGLWGAGAWSGSLDSASLGAMQASVDLGCNFFDSASAYGEGRSDRLLGELLRANRPRRIYVGTKVPPKNRQWPASSSDQYEDVFPREYVFEFADRIRTAIGVDTIDLLQLHVWDDSWSVSRAWHDTIAELKRRNIVAAFGISLNRWQPNNGILAVKTGLVDAVQVIYNIFEQAPEDLLFAACAEHNVGVIARVPLDEGSLAGSLTKDTEFPADDWRAWYFGPENLGPTVDRVEALKAVLPDGMDLAEMAMRFVLSNAQVSTTIAGMRTVEHVRANLAASDRGKLDARLIGALSAHRWDREIAPGAK